MLARDTRGHCRQDLALFTTERRTIAGPMPPPAVRSGPAATDILRAMQDDPDVDVRDERSSDARAFADDAMRGRGRVAGLLAEAADVCTRSHSERFGPYAFKPMLEPCLVAEATFVRTRSHSERFRPHVFQSFPHAASYVVIWPRKRSCAPARILTAGTPTRDFCLPDRGSIRAYTHAFWAPPSVAFFGAASYVVRTRSDCERLGPYPLLPMLEPCRVAEAMFVRFRSHFGRFLLGVNCPGRRGEGEVSCSSLAEGRTALAA